MQIRKEMLVVTFMILTLVLPGTTLAWPVPDTGQTKCYDNSEEIACPQPGEPFYGQDGNYSTNPQSYTKLDENGDDLPDSATSWVMVRDNVAGLICEVKTDDGSVHDRYNRYPWYDVQNVFIAALNIIQFGGFSDWRLPMVKELSYILSRDAYDPSINTAYFPNSVADGYWSSTPDARYSDTVYWYFYFKMGKLTSGWWSAPRYVRAVRGGKFFNNFIDNSDGTITDTRTCLMWQQDGFSYMTWQHALSYCESLTLAGYNDWCLPNINELQSLVDYSVYTPSINTAYFPNSVADEYWSSTSVFPYNRYQAWYVDFDDGNVHSDGKTSKSYVRAVRGGDCGFSFEDSDADGIYDHQDNCLSIPNGPYLGICTIGIIGQSCMSNSDCEVNGFCSMNQEDADGDEVGDGCDNCPDDPNVDQEDNDIDGLGDACDPDDDNDTVLDEEDNCPYVANLDQEDIGDGDGVGDACDNCPYISNSNQENNDGDELGNVCDNCPDDHNPEQEDTYPPQGNNCGDACECEADMNIDQNVDSNDNIMFNADFGRNIYNNPCTSEIPCNADFNCDHNVDSNDVIKFNEDFGRSIYYDPCPLCPTDPWCVYE